MPPGPTFRTDFFARGCLEVAPDLVGAYLVRRIDARTRLVGRIVEVEAYLGDGSDPGSHAHRGPTPRNRAMFGPPGRLYVYRSYGIHICANVVCGPDGSAAAVLLRAFEPVEGVEYMRKRRGLASGAPAHAIASGPGKLAQALDLTLEDYGCSLLRGTLRLQRPGRNDSPPTIATSPRIGLSRGADLPYRFYDTSSRCVSRAPRSPRR